MSRSHYTSLGDGGASTSTRRTRSSRPSSSNAATIVAGLTTSIGEMTKMNNKLERALARLGTAADTPDFRDRVHDDQMEFNALVRDTLQSVQAAKPELDGKQFTRLSLQFDVQYKKFHKLQEQIDTKHKQLLSKHLTDDDGPTAHLNGYGSTGQQQQQAQAQEEEVTFTEWHHEEVVRRVEEIKQIEGEVAEVAEMYKDLHLMVNEQQEGIDVVSDNIDVSKATVEQAQVQLEGAAEQQKKARMKKCCVAVLVVACIAVAVVVLVLLR